MKRPEKECKAVLRELGTLVFDARTALNISQHDIEDRLGLAGGYVSGLEGARRNVIPTLENIAAVAKMLQLDVDQVVTLVLEARLYRALAKTAGSFGEEQVATAAAAVATTFSTKRTRA